MKSWSLWLLLGISLLFGASCGKEPEPQPLPQPIKVTGITLDSSSLSLIEGETATLVATVSPKNADNQTVIWTSSNGSVASVNDGKVTALKAGETVITAKSDDGGYSASCSVTVNPKIIAVSSITLSKEGLTLVEGESETLIATVNPEDATDKTVFWSTSDASIATVEDGKVTALKEGVTTITAKAGDKNATCKVAVTKKIIEVESIELSINTLNLTEGDTETLLATVKPEDATDKTVYWTSSDSSIASVEYGKIIAIKEGVVTITAKAGDITAKCVVTVEKKKIPVESIELSETEISLTEGDTKTIIATVKPDDTTEKTVIWTSSDSGVAKVEEGKITAINEGQVTIIAKIGDKMASCKVTVNKKVIAVTSISLNKSELSLEEGQTEQLYATVKPDNATEKTVLWESSDASVVSVNNSGKVTTHKEGVATITAKAGDKLATCTITVTKKVIIISSVSLNKTELTIIEGDLDYLSATVKPDNATNKTLTWSSSDENVATVNEGVVTAIKEGSTTITVKTEDGGKIATCKVNVIKEYDVLLAYYDSQFQQSYYIRNGNEIKAPSEKGVWIRDIEGSNGHIYLLSSDYLWIDGVKQSLPSGFTGQQLYVDNGDLYIGGIISMDGKVIIRILKNGSIWENLFCPYNAYMLDVNDMSMSNNIMYVSASCSISRDGGPSTRIPIYWKGTECIILHDPNTFTNTLQEEVSSICAYQGNSYALWGNRYMANQFYININGSDEISFNCTDATKIIVDNRYIYVAGEKTEIIKSQQVGVPYLWVFDVNTKQLVRQVSLNFEGNYYSKSIADMSIINGIAHVVGSANKDYFATRAVAVYWVVEENSVRIIDNIYLSRQYTSISTVNNRH